MTVLPKKDFVNFMFSYKERISWPLLDVELIVSCKKRYWIFGVEPVGWGPYYKGIPGYLYCASKIHDLRGLALFTIIDLKCYI